MRVKMVKGSLRWAGQTKRGNWLALEVGAEAELAAREKPGKALAALVALLRDELSARWRELNKHGAPAPMPDGQRADARRDLTSAQVPSPDGNAGGYS